MLLPIPRNFFAFTLPCLLTGLPVGTAQTWQQLNDFSGNERDDGVVFVIGSTAYCGTGLTSWFAALADFRTFDMTTDQWSSIASLPMGEQRQYAVGFSWAGRGFVFGGIMGGTYLNDLWQYTPATDTWTAKSSLPSAGRSGASCFRINNMAYIIGGRMSTQTATDEVWAYDIDNDSWQQKNDCPFGACWRASACSLNGKGYLLFGTDENNDYHNSLYEYNPSTDGWALLSIFPAVGRTHAAMEAVNGQLVIMAGRDSLGVYANDLWKFHLADTSWTQLNPLPAQGRKGGLCFTNGTDLYYTTGIDSTNTRLNETWKCSSPVVSLPDVEFHKFAFYPNPATDYLTLKLAINPKQPIQLRVYNIQGQLLIARKIIQKITKLDIEHIGKGIFVMTLEEKGHIFRQEFVRY